MPNSGSTASQREGDKPRRSLKERFFSRSKGVDSTVNASSKLALNPRKELVPAPAPALAPESQIATSIAAEPETVSERTVPSTAKTLPPINRLWEEAYGDLKIAEEDLIKRYEKALFGDLSGGVRAASGVSIQVRMEVLLRKKVEEAKTNTWKIHFYGKGIPVKDLAGPVVGCIKYAHFRSHTSSCLTLPSKPQSRNTNTDLLGWPMTIYLMR
jgi:hypothetical protein